MIRSTAAPSGSQIIEPMIQLACCSRSHRIIVAGSKGREVMFELHRRGYTRVATTATCGLPCGQCHVALIDWQLQSIITLERSLGWLVLFLAPTAVLVIWLDSAERRAIESWEHCWSGWDLRSRLVPAASKVLRFRRGGGTQFK